MMMAQMALQLAQQSPPGMFDLEELNRSILQSANVPDLDKIMPRKPQPVPLDPISDIMAAVKGLPIKAFMGQNHDAHIQAKMAYMQDPQNGANPLMKRIAPVLEANMQEHLIMKYQEQVEGTAEQIVEQYGPEAIASGQVDPNDPRVMEMVMAQAAQQVAQANQAMAQMQQAATPEAQMVQIEQQRLQVEQAKVQAQTAKESVEAAMKNRELDLKEAQLQIDMMKEGIRTSTNAQEKEKDRNAKKAIAALDAIMDLAKTQETTDTSKMLKAADMVTDFVKEANKNS